jgi:hypothetical protein
VNDKNKEKKFPEGELAKNKTNQIGINNEKFTIN